MNYIRIYFRFVIIYMKGKLEYHFSLLLELIANTILIGVYFAGFHVIFYNFNSIAGWNKYEVLFMFTTSWLSYTILLVPHFVFAYHFYIFPLSVHLLEL